MRSVKTILVAIKDPEAPALPALHKAVQLAQGLGAKLEIFHALISPIYASNDNQYRDIRASERERAMRRLERLTSRIRIAGGRARLQVSIAAEWDFPAYEAVVRRARIIRAGLIIVERHLGERVVPALLHFNDWELLRKSPVPVLIVKRAAGYRHPTVLAAVDPSHDSGKPPELDVQILDFGTTVSAALAGHLHAVHAYQSPPEQLHSQALDGTASDAKSLAVTRERYNRLLRPYRVPLASRHLIDMEPVGGIETVAGRLGAQIAVLGALSRSGRRGVLIGNTAESILDSLGCDLLIVKLSTFVAPIQQSSNGARFLRTSSLLGA